MVRGASGLSAAGGGDFYYEDNATYRRHFGKFAERYGFRGAFRRVVLPLAHAEARWGYLATFLDTTLNASLREPYKDLDAILAEKNFFVLTTNQDIQFVKIYPWEKVAEIQGDHRFFQCSRCCTDEVWDAIEPVSNMIEAMGDGLEVPAELVPRCPHCGAEAFPWVRGYGNFLQGELYEEQYRKVSNWLDAHAREKILFLELGVGRMTPAFIQEPFWALTAQLPQAGYVAVNNRTQFSPPCDRGSGGSPFALISPTCSPTCADAGEVAHGYGENGLASAGWLAEADLVVIGASNGLDMAEGRRTSSAPTPISGRRTGISPRPMASAAYCRGSPPRIPTCDAAGPSGSTEKSISNMSPARL